MRANFVDTLLARLDGEVAPIWICVLLQLGARPEPEALRAGLRALVRETPRLRVAWRERERAWQPVARGDAEADAALIVDEAPVAESDAIARAIAAPIDLARDLPLQLRLARVDAAAPWSLSVALHHAIGDAKALGHLLERLWRLVPGTGEHAPSPADRPLATAGLTDAAVLRAALRRPAAALGLAVPKSRLLSARAAALRRSGDVVGAPILATVRFDLSAGTSETPAAICFAGVLAAAAPRAGGDGAIRLRVPVDLRRELGLGRPLGNGCSAVPLEFTQAELRALRGRPRALARLARERLAGLVAAGVPWTTALECLAVAALAPRAALRRGARPGLLAARRTNTLVVTYLGSVDRHFAGAPLDIRGARSHTATWGVTAFCLKGHLIVSAAAFAGLWSPDELRGFVADLAAWTSAGFGVPAEVLP